jgi:hypothetical protein
MDPKCFLEVRIRLDPDPKMHPKLKPPCLGLLGQQARESLLLCVSLCSKSPALEQYIAHHSNFCTILATGTVLVFEEDLPIAPLGPLRECLHPVVLYTSILSPTLSPYRCESPVQFCALCTCT